MPRPQKQGLDYFPLDVDMDTDPVIEYVEATVGPVAFGVVVKLLMRVYREGYYLPWTDMSKRVAARRFGVEQDTLDEVVEACLDAGFFDRGLHDRHAILTSRGIQTRYFTATSRRQSVEIVPEYLLVEPPTNGVSVNRNDHSSGVSARSNARAGENRSGSESDRSVVDADDNSRSVGVSARNNPSEAELMHATVHKEKKSKVKERERARAREEEKPEDNDPTRTLRSGGVMLPECLDTPLKIIEPDRFEGPASRYVWEAIEQQFGLLSPADRNTIAQAVRAGCIEGCEGEHAETCALHIVYKLRAKAGSTLKQSRVWLRRCLLEDRHEVLRHE